MAIAVAFTDGENLLGLGTAGQWTTITLPNVPASATGVIVDFYGDTNSSNAQGALRAVGSSITGSTVYTLGTNGSGVQVNNAQHWAPMNGSNQVDMYINSNCTYARVTGWLEANDVDFLGTEVNMWDYLESGDGSTPDTDHTFHLSTISGGAGAVLVLCQGTTASGTARYNWKRPGEIYASADKRRGNTATTFVYPLSDTGRVTFKFSHFTPSFIVLGFMGSNFTAYTGPSPEAIPISSTGWENAVTTSTSQGAHIAIFDHDAGASVWGGCQARGQPDRAVPDFWGYGSQYFVGLNGSKEYEHFYADAFFETYHTFCVGWFEPASLPTTPVISDVNGTDVVTHNAQLTINGSFPQTITSVKITHGAMESNLAITSQSATNVICSPYDVFSGNPKFGLVTISASDGTDTDTHAVTLVPDSNYQYVTLADPLIANGVNKDTTSVNGDQVSLAQTDGISTTMSTDADVLFSPAAINGQEIERNAHDGTTWNGDTITVYRGSFTGVEWTGTPTPPVGALGEPYEYYFGAFVSGDRPMVFTLETGTLPDGLVIDNDAETIVGTPTSAQSFTGLSIKADNTVASASVQVAGDDV